MINQKKEPFAACSYQQKNLPIIKSKYSDFLIGRFPCFFTL